MVENQTYLFIVFSLTGIGLGVLFDFFRALRKTFKTPDLVTYLEDIIYWILAGIIVLYNVWFFNDGEIRIYMILGILIGAVIYTLTLSTIFIKINYFIMSKIVNKKYGYTKKREKELENIDEKKGGTL